jgi:hypothetical protein
MDDASAEAYYQGDYRDEVNHADVNDEVDQERQRVRAHYQLHACWDYIEHARTMLEIGCSMGYLMDKMNIQFDTACVGVEPDVRYHKVEPACNFPLYTSICGVTNRKFDLIAMSHSLEHMQHPLQFIREALVFHGGKDTRFLIEVPNYAATPLTLNAQHPFAFTEDALNKLFGRIGYKPLMFVKHGLTFSTAPYYLLAVYGRV